MLSYLWHDAAAYVYTPRGKGPQTHVACLSSNQGQEDVHCLNSKGVTAI